MTSEDENVQRTQVIAQMAATIYAAEYAACIAAWQKGSDRSGPDAKDCAQTATDIYDEVDNLLWSPAESSGGE